MATPNKINYLCDFSSNSKKAWDWTVELKEKFNPEVEILHVVSPSSNLFLGDGKQKGTGLEQLLFQYSRGCWRH